MRGTALAIGWQLGARYRPYLAGLVVYLLVVFPLVHMLPDHFFFCRLVRFYAAFPLAMSPLGLFAVFLFGADTDFAALETSYPTRMLTLPVSSRALVGWPMFFGIAGTLVYCFGLTLLVLRPAGIMVPLGWPAVALAVTIAWTQAIGWSRSALPGLRLILLAVMITLQVGIVTICHFLAAPHTVLALLLAAQLPLCWYVGTRGLTRARSESSGNPGWPDWVVRLGVPGRTSKSRPFRGPAQAQRWLEWRIHGWSLPVMVAVSSFFLAILIVVLRHDPRCAADHFLRSPFAMFGLPVVLALNIGTMFGRFVSSFKDKEPSLFLATKPISSTDIVAFKLRAALTSVLAAYAVAGLAAVLLVTVTRSWPEGLPFVPPMEAYANRGILLWLAIPMLVFLTWRIGADFLFVGLTGRPWMGVFLVAFTLLGMMAAMSLGIGIHLFPTVRAAVFASLPVVGWLLVFIKLVLAGWVIRRLIRRQMLDPPRAVRIIAIWALNVVVLSVILVAIFSPSGAPVHLFIAAAILTVPAARLMIAPLALNWNRHR